MLTALKVIDDFLPEPNAWRALALSAPFRTVNYQDHDYHGVNLVTPPEDVVVRLLSKAMDGAHIRVESQHFRLGLAPWLGPGPTTWIHADTGCNAEWAAVLYLSNPPEPGCGTAFWQHAETGAAFYHPDDHYPYDADGGDQNAWAMVGLAGQVFGRVILYPTCLFHSRWPRDAWGDTPETGRLTWCAFFDAEPKKRKGRSCQSHSLNRPSTSGCA